MSLVRAWKRQITGASGAALLVPAAIFGSMVLLALAGGFGQLGGLGQALAGPAAPSAGRTASPLSSGGTGATAAAAPLLPVVAGGRGVTLVASVGSAGTSTGAAHGGSPGGGGHPGGGSQPTGPTGTGGSAPTTPATTTPTPAPPPTGGKPPTLSDEVVVSLGTSVTIKIPGPFGPLATSVLNNVGQTVNRVLPGNSRGGAGAVGSTVTSVQRGLGQLGPGVNHLLPGVHLP